MFSQPPSLSTPFLLNSLSSPPPVTSQAAQWIGLYGSRVREREDIREGMFLMYELRRQRLKERKTIRETLEIARRDLPSCIVLLKGIKEAVREVRIALYQPMILTRNSLYLFLIVSSLFSYKPNHL